MRAEFFTPYPSAQGRAVDPEAGSGGDHPRCLEMAETMRDIAAIGSCGFKDLIRAGFTSAEIIEHHDRAAAIAAEASVRQVTPSPDQLADMIAKARAPLPNRPLLPQDARETQPIYLLWGAYCAARSALVIDHWAGQRERCIDKLRDYLDRLPLLPRTRKQILLAVASSLQTSERRAAPASEVRQ